MKNFFKILALLDLIFFSMPGCAQNDPKAICNEFINALINRDGEKAWTLLSENSQFLFEETYKSVKDTASGTSDTAKEARKEIYGCLDGKSYFIKSMSEDKVVDAAKTMQILDVKTNEDWSKITLKQTVKGEDNEIKQYLVKDKGKWRIDFAGEAAKKDPEHAEEVRKMQEKTTLEKINKNQKEIQTDGINWSIKENVSFYKPGDSIPIDDLPNTFGTSDEDIKKYSRISDKYTLLWLTNVGEVKAEYGYWEQDYAFILRSSPPTLYDSKTSYKSIKMDEFKREIKFSISTYELPKPEDSDQIAKKDYWKLLDDQGNQYSPKYDPMNKPEKFYGDLYSVRFDLSFNNFTKGKNPKVLKLVYEGPLGKKGFEWDFKQ